MRILLIATAIFWGIILGEISAQERPLFSENMLIINEDNSHFFASRTPEQMTLDGLNAFIDQYAETSVTHLFLCPNASRANFSNEARNAIWEPNIDGKPTTGRWPENCKLLEEKGLDPYKIWIERAREKKISPWISMRMNDLHAADDPTNFMHSTFWASHPQLWREPNTESKSWPSRALNFKHEAVRKHATDFLDVLFARYDFDGLELDWMRFGWHLTPGHEAEEGHFLTEVVAYARKKADEWSVKRGHPIYLAARVPADPDAARGLGMDGVAWGKDGLIDLIIPCPFWTTTDFDIPVEVWKERLAGTKVAIAPGAEYNVRAFPSANAAPCSLAQLYGFAASEKFRGTTNVYLFNWMDCDTLPVAQAQYRTLLKNGFSDAFLASVPKEFPLTYRDTVPNGFSNGAQLPKTTGEPVIFRIPTGPKPASDMRCSVVIGLEKRDGVKDAAFLGALGGVAMEGVFDVPADAIPNAERAISFTFPASAFQDGSNEFIVTQTEGAPQRIVFVTARFALK